MKYFKSMCDNYPMAINDHKCVQMYVYRPMNFEEYFCSQVETTLSFSRQRQQNSCYTGKPSEDYLWESLHYKTRSHLVSMLLNQVLIILVIVIESSAHWKIALRGVRTHIVFLKNNTAIKHCVNTVYKWTLFIVIIIQHL